MIVKKYLVILTVAILFFAVPVLAEVQPFGDDFDTAMEIDVPGIWTGTIDDENTIDFYKFTLEPSDIIEIEFSSEATSDQRLKFYNPNRQELIRLNSKNSVTETDDYGLAYETEIKYWFISIERVFSGGNGDYSLTITLDSQDDAGSGGDVPATFDEAYEISEGVHHGMLKDLDNMDMYKIELQPTSIIDIHFTSKAPSTQRLRFYNPNRQEIFRMDSSGDSVIDRDYGLAYETDIGYWFISIEKVFSGSDGEYTLTITLDRQDDAGSGGDVPATFDEAYEISEGEHQGMLKDLDEKDMYKIELEPSTIIDIKFRSHADSDQTLKFYNPNREELFTIYSSGGSAYDNSYMLAYETTLDHWFISIERRYSGSDGDYILTITLDSQDDAGSGDDVPATFDEAYEISEGEFEGKIGGLDTADMYKIYVESNSVIEVKFSSESPSMFYGEHNLIFYGPDRSSIFTISSSDGTIVSDTHDVGPDMESDYRYIKVESAWAFIGIHSAAEYTITVSIEPLDDNGVTPPPGFDPVDHDLYVSPTFGEAPLTVWIEAEAYNDGDVSGEVPVTIDGDVLDIVDFGPNEWSSVSFQYIFHEPGTYSIVFGDQEVTVIVTEEPDEPVVPYSDIVTDPEGDVIRLVGPGEEDWAFVDSPDTDILRVEISESAGVVSVSLRVKGTIHDDPDIEYELFLKDHSNGEYDIWYTDGDWEMWAYREYHGGAFGNRFKPAVSGVGTDTLTFSFVREQIGEPDVLLISWAAVYNEAYPEVDFAGPDAEYPPGYTDPIDDDNDNDTPPTDDNGDITLPDDDNGIPGFTMILLAISLIFAVLIYRKKR